VVIPKHDDSDDDKLETGTLFKKLHFSLWPLAMFGQSIQSAGLDGRLYVFICLSQIKILKFMNVSGQMFAPT